MNTEKIRQQAQDLNTPPEILEQLINSGDKLTCQYVASNPNASLKTLNQLCSKFPDEVFDNPKLAEIITDKSQKIPLNLMITREKYLGGSEAVFGLDGGCEDAEVWGEFPEAIVINPQTSPKILMQLLNNGKERSLNIYRKILTHPNANGEIIYGVISQCSDSSLKELALKTVNTSAETLKAIASERDCISELHNYQLLTKHPHVSWEIITIAQITRNSEDVTPETLIEFACRSYGLNSYIVAVFQHQNMSAEVLDRLDRMHLPKIDLVKIAVVKHPQTTTTTLKLLAKDKNRFVREALLQRDRISQEIMLILADDSHESIRSLLAKVDCLSSEILLKLARDPSQLVRLLIAKREQLFPEAINILGKDPHESVRVAIAERTHLNQEIVTRLFNDPHELVRSHILRHHLQKLDLKAILNLAQEPREKVRSNLLESTARLIDFIPEMLRKLAQDESEIVRANVAYYQKLSPELITILSCDASLMVRCALVNDRNYHHNRFGANSHLPLAILWQMLEQTEADPDLATAPPLILNQAIYYETRNYELSVRLVNFYIKKAIAKHPETPLDYLLTLVKDEDAEIRAAAASSPKLSAIILNELINDQSKSVRFAVLDNPSVSSDTLQLYLARNQGVRRCIGGGKFKAREQLKKRKKNAICGMANLISWQKSLDTNTWVHTCRIIDRVRKRAGW